MFCGMWEAVLDDLLLEDFKWDLQVFGDKLQGKLQVWSPVFKVDLL